MFYCSCQPLRRSSCAGRCYVNILLFPK